jgi:hypothetical protein
LSPAPPRLSLRRLRPLRERPTERVALLLAVLVEGLGTGASIVNNNNEVKVGAITIVVIVLASLILGLRSMVILGITVALCVTLVFTVNGFDSSQLSISGGVMIIAVLAVALVQSWRRGRLGLGQISAETVIGMIRDRLLVQATAPEVPPGWTVQIQQRPADGAAISGDFVSNRVVSDEHGRVLHLVVVDVSGSGITAGPRALLLSGAVGGLLGSVSPDEFMVAANAYLSRQKWALGFASAIYVTLDLDTGAYAIRVAGHPPALHHRPERQPEWRVSPATGTVLGVLATVDSVADTAELQPGESLFLYTDGVVEDRNSDLDSGIKRLTEAVDGLQRTGAAWRAESDALREGVAGFIIDNVPAARDDDRTVVMIRRELVPVSQAAAVPSLQWEKLNQSI